jgi:hypothetical protein
MSAREARKRRFKDDEHAPTTTRARLSLTKEQQEEDEAREEREYAETRAIVARATAPINEEAIRITMTIETAESVLSGPIFRPELEGQPFYKRAARMPTHAKILLLNKEMTYNVFFYTACIQEANLPWGAIADACEPARLRAIFKSSPVFQGRFKQACDDLTRASSANSLYYSEYMESTKDGYEYLWARFWLENRESEGTMLCALTCCKEGPFGFELDSSFTRELGRRVKELSGMNNSDIDREYDITQTPADNHIRIKKTTAMYYYYQIALVTMAKVMVLQEAIPKELQDGDKDLIKKLLSIRNPIFEKFLEYRGNVPQEWLDSHPEEL